MTQTLPDILGTRDWQDIAALQPAVAGRMILVQAKSGQFNHIFFGGAAAPGARDGQMLPGGESFAGEADHVWVRGNARFSVTIL